MVQGKPILGSINPNNDLENILGRSGAGLITINGDDDGFLKNALKLLHDTDMRKTMGRNSKKLHKDLFSVEQAVDKILENIKS